MLALALQILTLAATSVTASGTFINATTYTVAITVAPGPTVPLSLKPGARGPSWAAWPQRILVGRGIGGAERRKGVKGELPRSGAGGGASNGNAYGPCGRRRPRAPGHVRQMS